MSEYKNADWNGKSRCAVIRACGNTASVYKNGKFMILGARSEELAMKSMSTIQEMFGRLGFEVTLESFRTVNTTMTWSTGRHIDLNRLASDLQARGDLQISYDPGIISCLSVKEEGISLIVNHSGSVLINVDDRTLRHFEVCSLCDSIAEA